MKKTKNPASKEGGSRKRKRDQVDAPEEESIAEALKKCRPDLTKEHQNKFLKILQDEFLIKTVADWSIQTDIGKNKMEEAGLPRVVIKALDHHTSPAPVQAHVIPESHRPRNVDTVLGHWKTALDKINRNEAPRLGDCKILHFFGESGAGKSDSATYDTQLAVENILGEGSCTVIHTTLSDTADLIARSTNKKKRNTEAQRWAENKLVQTKQCPEKVLIFVVDEFQRNISLCRALSASCQDLRDFCKKDSGLELFLVFCGLAIADIEDSKPLDTQTVSSDKKMVETICVSSWPRLSKMSDIDIAAQFVEREHRRAETQETDDSSFDEKFTAEKLRSESGGLVELLRMAKRNMAAISYIAKKVTGVSFTDIGFVAASELHKATVKHLSQRNSNKGNKWEKNKQLLPVAEALFDLAVLGEATETEAIEFSKWGLLSFVPSSKSYKVSVNGFYWHVLLNVFNKRTPDPFLCSAADFEVLSLEWLKARVTAFVRHSKVTHVALRELVPGTSWTQKIQLPTLKDLSKVGVQKLTEKLEGGSPTHAAISPKNRISLAPTRFLVNGDKAAFSDGIGLLSGCAAFIQAKLSTNLT